MNCKPAFNHKHSVIVNHYETELRVNSSTWLNYTLKTKAFTSLWTEKAHSMYEGKERIKERVGEREHSFKLLLVRLHRIKHTVLFFTTGLNAEALIWTVD